MNKVNSFLSLTSAAILALSSTSATVNAAETPFAIAIHGGAGTIQKSEFTPEREQAYRAKLQEAVETGYAVLDKGGESLTIDAAYVREHVGKLAEDQDLSKFIL